MNDFIFTWDCPLPDGQTYQARIPITQEQIEDADCLPFLQQVVAIQLQRSGCSADAIQQAIQEKPKVWQKFWNDRLGQWDYERVKA